MSYYPAFFIYVVGLLWLIAVIYETGKLVRNKIIREKQKRRRAEHIQRVERYRRGF